MIRPPAQPQAPESRTSSPQTQGGRNLNATNVHCAGNRSARFSTGREEQRHAQGGPP